MSENQAKNVAASVRARLTNLAKSRGEEFQLVLSRYAVERFLYRLSVSDHASEFVLKGAMLFQLWAGEPHRATRDLDLLGRGDSSTERLAEVVRGLCSLSVPDDGLAFDAASVAAARIREDQEYEGVRVTAIVRLGNARIPLQIDVGFGDAVVPAPTRVQYPTLLGFPAPTLGAYPREAVVAEKFQAMVALGIGNSRMKDFFDLWVLCRDFPFEGENLARALAATFERRKTAVPVTAPLALTNSFRADPVKVVQWEAFIRKGRLDAKGMTLEAVCEVLSDFLMPVSGAVAAREPFPKSWKAGGPWR